MTKKTKPVKSSRSGDLAKGSEAPAPAPAKPKQEAALAPGGTLDERQTMRIAKALADPRRMSILRAIAQKNSACSEMRTCLSISAATLSHHMKELENAGLISTSKDGRFLNASLEKKVWKGYIATLKSLAD